MSYYDKQELCTQITTLYPDIGECGSDITVAYDEQEKAWVVHLKDGPHSLDHFLEQIDADSCMDGKQCIGLGLDIAQLKKNLHGKQF
ncbi:hypothetical protein JWJ90_08140 [Desulfobulbus rhabdoformis]|uniref:hypothetical protein n=1 Tax=Desulfobulbus rhabdoformis TaxID=34032 RepID=UPI0019663897|nr:hypothetical protein [Desulfobulbus rhabdoformis]MBM9614258.1 hypothetical protein [Desulfobulbus rhabdoformis]